jgi:GntP family gluconate:H+ symporter
MILAALLLPLAIAAIVLAIQRLRLPAYLALMLVVLAYGIAANMTFQSIGKAFGLGFVAALEQTGLLVMAGSLVSTLALKHSLAKPAAAMAGVLAGLGGTATGGLALLQPAGRAVALALTILIVHALIAPSPIAVAAMSVMKADLGTMLWIGVPVAAIVVGAVWIAARDDRSTGKWSWTWLAVAVPLALLVVQAISQMPSEPLGKGGAREFYTGISRSLILAVLAVVLAIVFSLVLTRRWQPALLADTSWAPLLLTVGAAGGFARVLDETGMAELLAERVLDPRLGLLVPFLAALIVKTMQGNSLSAVLTASGMVEPLLPALGLDSASGRALAAAAAGAGAIAICHFNDPLFWIAGHMAGFTPAKALRTISVGSLLVGMGAFVLLFGLSRIL